MPCTNQTTGFRRPFEVVGNLGRWSGTIALGLAGAFVVDGDSAQCSGPSITYAGGVSAEIAARIRVTL